MAKWRRRDCEIVLGYYALAPCTLAREELTQRQARGLPDQIPAYLIAKLALDRGMQGQHLGSHLLMSALERIAVGSDDLGGRFAVVDAIDDIASSYDVHHGFEAVDGVQGRLVLPITDIRAAMARYEP